MALINSMSMRGKLTLAGCALAFLAAAVLILKMATAPSYSTVMAGMDPTKSSQVTAALDAAGVSWKLAGGGTQVEVKQGQETEARVALAGKGLTTSTQPDFSQTLDKQKLGASNMQQQVAYQRGLEGEIANTISQVQGAGGATVHLSLPKDDLFTTDNGSATAAVLLGGSADSIDPAAVRGIANLVASSVPKLKPANVTITDATGTMLWPTSAGSGGDSGGQLSKPAAEARYDAMVEQKLNALLTQTLGANKAQVQVHADLDVDKTHLDTLTYGKKTIPLTAKTTTESLKGTGAAAAGAAGTASNLPSYAAAATGSGSGTNNYSQKTTDVTNGVDKTVASTDKAQGAVNTLDIGLVLDAATAKTLGPAGVTALQNTLQSAAGFQKGKGTFSLSTLPFAKSTAPAAAAKPLVPPAFAGILKGVGLGFGALMFLIFVTRYLRKREREELIDEPTWLRQLPRPAEPELMGGPALGGAEPTVVMQTLATTDPRRQALENIVRNEPDRVAAHLRSWITEDNA